MSLGQWLRSKVFLKRNRPGDLKNNTVSGSSGISTKFENNSLKKYLFVAILALIVAPIAYLLPEIQRWASATTWQTASNFDTAGDVGLYGSSILDNDGLISTTYYDKTNTKVKYAQRGAGGTWMVEDVETLAADYTGGVNSDRNTKFGIAKDPSDNNQLHTVNMQAVVFLRGRSFVLHTELVVEPEIVERVIIGNVVEQDRRGIVRVRCE
jgi:hypothetical protein